MMRCYLAYALATMMTLLAPTASAHPLLEPAETKRLFAIIDEGLKTIQDSDDPEVQARAQYEIGDAVDTIVSRVNEDIAAHGGDIRFDSAALILELNRLGIMPVYDAKRQRYRSYLAPLEAAMALWPPDHEKFIALRFRVLSARFYDNLVDDDPLDLSSWQWSSLMRRIEESEAFLRDHPDSENTEEANFILGVEYAQAAMLAKSAHQAETFRKRGHDALSNYVDAYPESIRTAAARRLIKQLEHANPKPNR